MAKKIKASKLIALFQQALNEGWGYIWGTAGELWTQKKQDALKNETSSNYDQAKKYGSKWIGKMVTDCSGLFNYAFDKLGSYIPHGSNSIWKSYCSDKGELVNGKRSDGKELKDATALFRTTGEDRHHIGLYLYGKIIDARSTQKGVTDDSDLSSWDEWGELKYVDYDEVIIVIEQAKVIGGSLNLRSGTSTSANKIVSIPNGAVVDVIEKTDNEWWKITYSGKTGYVMSKFLTSAGSEMITLNRSVAQTFFEALKVALG